MTPLVGRMTVAGVGLVGGSLAIAARRAGLVGEVVGFGRSAANLALARERGIVDRVARDAADAVCGADMIVLAVPVGACAALAERFRPHAPPAAILTDVGSVKGGLVQALEARWGAAHVVGAHPIAGSEASGAGAADGELFRDRPCVLTPTAATAAQALAVVRALWAGVGARVVEMPAAVHDGIFARVSHTPHLLAYALVGAVAEVTVGEHPALAWAASGFRDATRIAASRSELWRDIFLANAPAVRAALAEFRGALDRLETLVARGDAAALGEALERARRARRALDGDR